MKKCIVILVIVLIVGVFVSGCRKSIGDRIAENMVEDMTGADVDISGDGENVKIETEEGTIEAGDSVEWPGDTMADVPKPKATITAVLDIGGNGCSVGFSGMSKGDAEQYIADLEALGYTDGMNMTDGDGLFYMGTKEDGSAVTFTYENESGDGMVSYSEPQE